MLVCFETDVDSKSWRLADTLYLHLHPSTATSRVHPIPILGSQTLFPMLVQPCMTIKSDLRILNRLEVILSSPCSLSPVLVAETRLRSFICNLVFLIRAEITCAMPSRRSRPKSRNGCVQCKARKIKVRRISNCISYHHYVFTSIKCEAYPS